MKLSSEMTWKLRVAKQFFSQYDVKLDEEFIDFVVSPKQNGEWTNYRTLLQADALLWAEAKRTETPTAKMFAQLLLTIKPLLNGKDSELPPKFLAVFDNEYIAFAEFYHVQPILAHPDINWNETPSSVSKKTENIVANILAEHWIQYNILTDIKEIKNFIALNLIDDGNPYSKLQVTKNNFLSIFTKWANEVQPNINYDWKIGKKNGLLPADFYLADLLSRNNRTIFDSLKVVLRDTEYKITVEVKEQLFKEVHFKDGGKSHRSFWKRYQRPPENEYQEYIKSRRDLLVPQNIREYTGAYFTPEIWVETSQNYLAQTFGENWQDEYYIWDCAAGTGNLLEGLTNKYNIWASTLMPADVDIMKDRIKRHGFNLLESHVFQFDFLNDEFDDLPKGLRDIVKDPEKRKKLIIYINPPYGECGKSAGTGKSNKYGIASTNKTHKEFETIIGKASRELFAMFMVRVRKNLPDAKLATFAKIKYVNSPNFVKFREYFQSEYKGGFIVLANTFDNVKGNFPIGFLIWDTESTKPLKRVRCDVMNNNGKVIDTKTFYATDKKTKFLNDWIDTVKSLDTVIGSLSCKLNDFQNNQMVYIANSKNELPIGCKALDITKENLIEACIYLSVRHCISATWLNDRDQFLYPNDGWKKDKRFQRNCFIFTLFHSQNRMTSKDGVNHWLPFRALEVNAADNFASEFMADYLNEYCTPLSAPATAVHNAGKALWTYYHEHDNIELNASLYEIREYFKGRNGNGRLNTTSTDEKFNVLDKTLRNSLNALAEAIKPKVYEYGFLME